MSRAEPTAGEWTARAPRGGRGGALCDADVTSNGRVIGRAFGDDAAEASANARLFAASKDLLAACEAALKWATYWDTNEQAKRDADTIRAAIAKAKGEP